MAKSSKKQNTYVIAVSIGVLVVSVFVTLYATGVLFGGSGSDSKGYRNVTFTDAVLTCQNTTRETYGDRIRNLVIDNHSSRFDDKQFLYKIFLKMDLFDKNRDKARLHYINCFVKSSNGRVRKYEAFEEVEQNRKRMSDDTNMFGMPKRKK